MQLSQSGRALARPERADSLVVKATISQASPVTQEAEELPGGKDHCYISRRAGTPFPTEKENAPEDGTMDDIYSPVADCPRY
ncbi:hypothetical protein NDU88_010580 [Pleurodeles waltl]|uniref:Uncharacterized protein n=1 Tax=Pleurodeles waltl TaxID=8319 RepID=A0AAV7PWE9_PLEWA|nr:hypothetical protein NDU88_010580 [Pleurodeles waltl]